jgi:hypothetical protein
MQETSHLVRIVCKGLTKRHMVNRIFIMRLYIMQETSHLVRIVYKGLIKKAYGQSYILYEAIYHARDDPSGSH